MAKPEVQMEKTITADRNKNREIVNNGKASYSEIILISLKSGQ
jgi:hypothetical protein